MNNLIPFAGDDGRSYWAHNRTELSFVKPGAALRLFRSGLDTLDIARRLGVTEAQALKLLTTARNDERIIARLPL